MQPARGFGTIPQVAQPSRQSEARKLFHPAARVLHFDLRLVVQHHVQQLWISSFSVVINIAPFVEFVHEEAHGKNADCSRGGVRLAVI
jgi:hypothetical protein